jgi:hypothetical protein
MEAEKDERVEAVEVEAHHVVQLQPKRYTPPNCSMCTELRPKPDLSYVTVYHTRREDGYIFHYCKCSFCNNTFKHSEKL